MRRARSRNGGGASTSPRGERAASVTGRTNIPTDLLRTFVAICELGSFTKAAHLFDLTQPAVSAHMRRLESIIGADLIEKSLSGVTLTDCGAEVLRHARRMLVDQRSDRHRWRPAAQPAGDPDRHSQSVRADEARQDP